VIHFCTYFDRNYLTRGLALHDSLVRHSDPFELWVLCFDDETFRALRALNRPSIRPISLLEFEDGDEALLAAKQNRSRIEYYFTCTPTLAAFILSREPAAEAVIYLDADLMFFGNPRQILNTLTHASVGIVPHQFPRRLAGQEIHGRFNVGWVYFRNDAIGAAVLADWRRRCLEWCYDRVEPGRFGDQKYLDAWPEGFERVAIIRHPGAVMAPWNFEDHVLTGTGSTLQVDGSPFILYHYQGFKQLTGWAFDLGLARYGTMDRATRLRIYVPYVRALRAAEALLDRQHSDAPGGAGVERRGRVRRTLRTLANLARGRILYSVGRYWL
jgi:hypothetical protein